ncbi:MAG TPA: amidophosphoribosyltransferase [Acidimicrobiaceae bacterium]|nr:amidophosphoribosyltransferase [Acidimicrobiaceae bacterium]HCV34834.1 amidophosphoribosyltransferase [Acidimicrobiaceae bacterium]|tara:strand:+ start:5557 stop:6453 length:897 start_codon:yes stop_codon:yes gene_type:complete
MCGIVGLFLKTERHEQELGRLTALMLEQMRDRGPDSAGFAIYGDDRDDRTRLTVLAEGVDIDWPEVCGRLSENLESEVSHRTILDHAVIETRASGSDARQWIIDHVPEVTVLGFGHAIELYKAVGDPKLVAERYGLADRRGTHAIAHTRMATESAVTTGGSHPFSTGEDTCLVHNGSLSNHNLLREVLESKGVSFQTENDTEVAAGYVAWRLTEGDSLEEAMGRGIDDLDGFYTFCVGTRDGFAVVRDPIACKPAVMAETDDWVAMASEYRAIAQLPDVNHAVVWEPDPAKIFAWSRA